MEVQADAEEEEDDAEFGHLAGLVGIGLEARRVRPDDDAGDEQPAKPKGGGSQDDVPSKGDGDPKGLDNPSQRPPFTLPESAGGF
jgi:hypothetical protein